MDGWVRFFCLTSLLLFCLFDVFLQRVFEQEIKNGNRVRLEISLHFAGSP